MNRVALNLDEYISLKEFSASMSTFMQTDILEKRLRETGTGWRDWKLMAYLYTKLLTDLLATTPQKQSVYLAEEMKLADIRTLIRKPSKDNNIFEKEDMAVVPRSALVRVMKLACGVECFACRKKGKQVNRCKLRRDISELMLFEPAKNGEECPIKDIVFEEVE